MMISRELVPDNAKIHWYGGNIAPKLIASATDSSRTHITHIHTDQPDNVMRAARKTQQTQDLAIRRSEDAPTYHDDDALLLRRGVQVECMNDIYKQSMAEAKRAKNTLGLERLAKLEIAQELAGVGTLRNVHQRSDINRRVAISEDKRLKGGYHIDAGEFQQLHSLPKNKSGFINVIPRQLDRIHNQEMFFFGAPYESPDLRLISQTMAQKFEQAAKNDPENSIQVPSMPKTSDSFDSFSIYLRNMGAIGCRSLHINGTVYVPRDLSDRKRLWQQVRQEKVQLKDIHKAYQVWERESNVNAKALVAKKNTMFFSERGMRGGIAYIHQAGRAYQCESVEELEQYMIDKKLGLDFHLSAKQPQLPYAELIGELKSTFPEIMKMYPHLRLQILKAHNQQYDLNLYDPKTDQTLLSLESSALHAFNNRFLTDQLTLDFIRSGPPRLTESLSFLDKAPETLVFDMTQEKKQKQIRFGHLCIKAHNESWMQRIGRNRFKQALVRMEPITYEDYAHADYVPKPSEFQWVVKPRADRTAAMIETIMPLPGQTAYFGQPGNIHDKRVLHQGVLV